MTHHSDQGMQAHSEMLLQLAGMLQNKPEQQRSAGITTVFSVPVFQQYGPQLKRPEELPMGVLPNELQEVIRYVQQETQASVGLIACSVLGMMALSCQDMFDISPKAQLRFPLSLYQVVLAESGA